MKKYFLILSFILIYQCSFDDKSGIWKNKNYSYEEKSIFSEFKTLSSSEDVFSKIITLDKKYLIKKPKKVKNILWNDIYYHETNNIENFDYSNLNSLVFKSKRISKYKNNSYIISEKKNIIFSDIRGNINIFSINEKKIIDKFNFYKKKYKNLKKELNLIVEDGIIYVSDNIGFLYAYNLNEKKVLWAKNYRVPFSSNLKIYKNKLIAANQNNNFYFFNKVSGKMLKFIPTEEITVKNEFKNNLSINDETSFFLNTYGTLYAFDNNSMKMNWFLNLNQSTDLNLSNLFSGIELIAYNNLIVASSNKSTYIIEAQTGSIIYKKNFKSVIKPLISSNHLFIITKNDLLICINLINGETIYSYDINQKIADQLKTKKRKVSFKDLKIANNLIMIFLENSYVLKFDLKGNLVQINKLPSRIDSKPIFLESKMFFLDNKNRIYVIN